MVVRGCLIAMVIAGASAFQVPGVSLLGGGLARAGIAARMRPQSVPRVAAASLRMIAAPKTEKEKTEVVSTAQKVTSTTSVDMGKLNMGMATMIGQLDEMRTAEVVQAWKEGKIGKREASTLTLKRFGKKFGIGTKTQSRDADDSSKGVFMEGGWAKRGKGSSIVRTFELYSFGIKIALREFKLRKVEDKLEKSEARKLIASDLRQGLLELGPTFIKLGQLLSTRIDILSKE